MTDSPKRRLPPGLYAITPDTLDDDWLSAAAAAAIRGGAGAIQLRSKRAGPAQRLRQAQRLAEICRELGARLIINDSVELAEEVGAYGVHLGRDDGDPLEARRRLGQEGLIGLSCYDDFARALRWRDVADYVAFGSVFVSSVKPDAVRAPLALFTRARAQGLDSVGIGGIDAGNAGQVFVAGARAVAVISAVFGRGEGAAPVEVERNARRIAEVYRAVGQEAAGSD